MPRLDVIVFGATGFTGKHAVLTIMKLSKEKKLTWGISGRNKAKLQDVLKEIGVKSGEDLSNIEIITADVNDDESLNQMSSRARVVVNCTGPYRFYGEAVVKACIESGTHHVDVSGEPQYMERMQLEYHQAAKEKGVYVISACGFDSIPNDLGTVYLRNEFDGDVNSVETYLESWTTGPREGASIHYGTWASAVYGLAHKDELRPLREKLFPNKMPKMLPELQSKSVVHKTDLVQGWCLPFLGSDASVMRRSQRYFYEVDKQRPIQIRTYVAFRSLLAILGLAVVGSLLAVLCRFKIGRKLLLKYPRFFTGGFVSHEGPTEQGMENTHFATTLYGEGWTEKLSDPIDQHTTPPNKKMICKVSGTNPGYGATCMMLVLAAITVVTQTDKMPNKGGVYAPGAAFAKTSLIEELVKHGINFEVLSSEVK